MEMLQEGISQLLAGLVAIILSVVSVIGVYALAYLRKKMKLQDQLHLRVLAEEAIFGAEERAQGNRKSGTQPITGGLDKEEGAISSLLFKAKAAGVKLATENQRGMARAAVRGALGRLRSQKGF